MKITVKSGDSTVGSRVINTTLDYIKMMRDFEMAHYKKLDKKYWHHKELLVRGTQFKTINRALSADVQRMTDSKTGQCYYNCQKTVLLYAEDIKSKTSAIHGLRYFEGYAMGVIPFAHAWLADDNGEVVDPTWATMDAVKDGAVADYFGVECPVEFIRKAWEEIKIAKNLIEDYILS